MKIHTIYACADTKFNVQSTVCVYVDDYKERHRMYA